MRREEKAPRKEVGSYYGNRKLGVGSLGYTGLAKKRGHRLMTIILSMQGAVGFLISI